MRTQRPSQAAPIRPLLAALSVVLLSTTSTTTAWSTNSSPSDVTALYFEENRSFRVYLMPEEILYNILLPGFQCEILEKQAYIKAVTKSNRTRGTLLQWNDKEPPEKQEFFLRMNCSENPVDDGEDVPPTTPSTPLTRASPKSRRRVVRDSGGTAPTATPEDSDLKEERETTTTPTNTPEPNTGQREQQEPASTESPPSTAAISGLESTIPTAASTVMSSTTTTTPATESKTTPVAEPSPAEVTSLSSSPPSTTTTKSTTTTTKAPLSTEATTVSMESSATNSGIMTDSVANDSLVERKPAEEEEPMSATDDPRNPEKGFSLVITRVSLDFVHGQELASLDDALNITREIESAMANRKRLTETLTKSFPSSSEDPKPPCLLLPKEVRVVETQYVLFSLGLNSTSGELIRGGNMLRTCGYEDWRPGKEFLADAAHVRFLDAKLFQLQILSVSLAVAVIVFALLAVFLCTKWRLAVRGSRREAHHEFFIKTFNTKEHQYAANGDDFYGFPTIRRDSTFYRSPNSVNAPSNQTGGNSFVNGAFQDGEDHQNLPAPPPELRTCIINDANFTDVPLHNLGSDSLRAHRGAHRHQSPPPPPLRTVSSGYRSGQSTPAVEYHNPHDVMILPPIPTEDYSDSDSESGHASLKTDDDSAGRAVERKGRFTVRTAL
ncbi:mucin-5AC [Galendromus occidentalis]|uniref:Mucin-5AC n=1 Tax=Galendromus occidentalis TaxID=34638 RepID=A0AAJ6VXF5_9ACAR|nr:mucin-5AC [Galendromus occidentalis]